MEETAQIQLASQHYRAANANLMGASHRLEKNAIGGVHLPPILTGDIGVSQNGPVVSIAVTTQMTMISFRKEHFPFVAFRMPSEGVFFKPELSGVFDCVGVLDQTLG